MTDSRQACFAGSAAPVFQEESDGLLPLVTRCENFLFKQIFLPKGYLIPIKILGFTSPQSLPNHAVEDLLHGLIILPKGSSLSPSLLILVFWEVHDSMNPITQ